MDSGMFRDLGRDLAIAGVVLLAAGIGIGWAIAKLLPHLHLSFHWS